MRLRVVASIFIVGLATVVGQSRAETAVIRLTVVAPPNTPVWRGADAFRIAVNSQLDGKARIEFKDVTGDPLEAVKSGSADLAVLNSSGLASAKAHRLALFDLPFFFRDLNETAALQDSGVGQAMLGAVNEDGLVGLAYWNTGMTQLFGAKPVVDFNQLKGAKLRTTVSFWGRDAVTGFGISSVALAAPDVPAALASGAIDYVETAPAFVSQKLLALEPTIVSKVNYRPVVSVLVANAKVWKGLTLRVQMALVEQARLAAARINADAAETEQAATIVLAEQRFRTSGITAAQSMAFGTDAAAGWQRVDALQNNGFLGAALGVRDELRRINYDVPRRRTDIPAAKTGRQLTVAFATDRRDDKDTDPGLRFAGAGGGTISWGQTEITVDPARAFGSGDTAKLGLTRIDVANGRDGFVATVAQLLSKAPQKDILIYVHGFKTTFKMAAESAAQIALDTKFNGVPLIYSWPSDGSLWWYASDEEEVAASRNNFTDALKVLASIPGLRRIHVISHSMGGRLASNTSEWLAAQPADARPSLHHLILAAPDIRTKLFLQAAAGMRALSKRVTIYSSVWDQALQCSLWFHGAARAGQGGNNVLAVDGIDTVDASAVESPAWYGRVPCTPFGHGYISENPVVLGDVYTLLTFDAGPKQRQRLQEQQKDGVPYWQLK